MKYSMQKKIRMTILKPTSGWCLLLISAVRFRLLSYKKCTLFSVQSGDMQFKTTITVFRSIEFQGHIKSVKVKYVCVIKGFYQFLPPSSVLKPQIIKTHGKIFIILV